MYEDLELEGTARRDHRAEDVSISKNSTIVLQAPRNGGEITYLGEK